MLYVRCFVIAFRLYIFFQYVRIVLILSSYCVYSCLRGVYIVVIICFFLSVLYYVCIVFVL